MTIKQQGGVFGRNPSFNDVEANSLDVNGPTTTGSPLSVEHTGFPITSMLRKFTPSAPAFGLGGLDYKAYSTGTTEVVGARIVPRSEGAWSGSSAPTSLVFQTVNFGSTSLSDKVTIKAAGDVQLNAGNLVVANGKGIDFSATSGTGTSELFDDYEEGTWTPTLKALTTDFDSVTYDAIRSASYTKIGRVVQIQLTMRTDAITVGSATGLLAIGGLPFTPVTGNVGASSLSVSVGSAFASNTPMAAEVSGGANDIYLLYRSSVSGNTAYCQAADAATGANANYVRISGTYTTS